MPNRLERAVQLRRNLLIRLRSQQSLLLRSPIRRDAVVLALETWVSHHNIKPGTKRELPKGAPMPSEDPNRREVITLLG
jgi:hypothetical protein